MDVSRLSLVALAALALGACDAPVTRPVVPSADAPTPPPVLPVPSTLAFTPPFARGIILILNGSVRPDLVLVSDVGESIPVKAGLAFISRNPEFVTVDSSGLITGKAMGLAWIVASLKRPNDRLRDSIQVSVRCSLELSGEFTPPTATLRAGESFVPQLTVWTCQRQLQVQDTFWWRTSEPSTVVRVDSATGRTTALAPGSARLVAIGTRGNSYWSLPVAVIP